MGLMMSVLVFSVGVLEALSCADHIRHGYLPLDIGRKRRRLVLDVGSGTIRHRETRRRSSEIQPDARVILEKVAACLKEEEEDCEELAAIFEKVEAKNIHSSHMLLEESQGPTATAEVLRSFSEGDRLSSPPSIVYEPPYKRRNRAKDVNCIEQALFTPINASSESVDLSDDLLKNVEHENIPETSNTKYFDGPEHETNSDLASAYLKSEKILDDVTSSNIEVEIDNICSDRNDLKEIISKTELSVACTPHNLGPLEKHSRQERTEASNINYASSAEIAACQPPIMGGNELDSDQDSISRKNIRVEGKNEMETMVRIEGKSETAELEPVVNKSRTDQCVIRPDNSETKQPAKNNSLENTTNQSEDDKKIGLVTVVVVDQGSNVLKNGVSLPEAVDTLDDRDSGWGAYGDSSKVDASREYAQDHSSATSNIEPAKSEEKAVEKVVTCNVEVPKAEENDQDDNIVVTSNIVEAKSKVKGKDEKIVVTCDIEEANAEDDEKIVVTSNIVEEKSEVKSKDVVNCDIEEAKTDEKGMDNKTIVADTLLQTSWEMKKSKENLEVSGEVENCEIESVTCENHQKISSENLQIQEVENSVINEVVKNGNLNDGSSIDPWGNEKTLPCSELDNKSNNFLSESSSLEEVKESFLTSNEDRNEAKLSESSLESDHEGKVLHEPSLSIEESYSEQKYNKTVFDAKSGSVKCDKSHVKREVNDPSVIIAKGDSEDKMNELYFDKYQGVTKENGADLCVKSVAKEVVESNLKDQTLHSSLRCDESDFVDSSLTNINDSAKENVKEISLKLDLDDSKERLNELSFKDDESNFTEVIELDKEHLGSMEASVECIFEKNLTKPVLNISEKYTEGVPEFTPINEKQSPEELNRENVDEIGIEKLNGGHAKKGREQSLFKEVDSGKEIGQTSESHVLLIEAAYNFEDTFTDSDHTYNSKNEYSQPYPVENGSSDNVNKSYSISEASTSINEPRIAYSHAQGNDVGLHVEKDEVTISSAYSEDESLRNLDSQKGDHICKLSATESDIVEKVNKSSLSHPDNKYLQREISMDRDSTDSELFEDALSVISFSVSDITEDAVTVKEELTDEEDSDDYEVLNKNFITNLSVAENQGRAIKSITERKDKISVQQEQDVATEKSSRQAEKSKYKSISEKLQSEQDQMRDKLAEVKESLKPVSKTEETEEEMCAGDSDQKKGQMKQKFVPVTPRKEQVLVIEELTSRPCLLRPVEDLTSPDKAFWLIFSGEYTKAMSKDWHSGHFCCWQCDESLTGQRYVLRDDHPYCIKCYEQVFANTCDECSKVIGIDSKDLSYKDKHWHEACFLCSKCRVSLVDKQFGSKADKIYCGNCYDAQFASRCDGCGQIFRAGTKKMEYKTRQWHEQCFCCCVCKSAIGTKSFIPREQEIYCATCYEEKFATRCVKCNKIITSGGVTYKNEPWHRECFTCTNCSTSLAGQRFTSRDEKPYCADCFGELFAKRCTACCKPITGIGGTRFISFEDRHWHNDCFICASCKSSLVGRGFITDAEDILCTECAKAKLM